MRVEIILGRRHDTLRLGHLLRYHTVCLGLVGREMSCDLVVNFAGKEKLGSQAVNLAGI